MISINKLIHSKGLLRNSLFDHLVPVNIDDFNKKIDFNKKNTFLLGLDIGRYKCGIAISSGDKLVSIPLEIIKTELLLNFIQSYTSRSAKFGLVIGMPLTLSGQLGSSANGIISVVKKISPILNVSSSPIWFHDERFTTAQCKYFYKNSKKENVDDFCAMTILQEHLDSTSNSN